MEVEWTGSIADSSEIKYYICQDPSKKREEGTLS